MVAWRISQGGTGQVDAPGARKALGLEVGVNVQPFDTTLSALAAFNTNGFLVQTAADTFVGRTLQAPAAGFTITNPAGTAGNPTFVLSNDLAALEALSGTNNIYYRSGVDTWSSVTIGTNLSFSGGTLNNTYSFSLGGDLTAIEALATTGIAVRTATDTWTTRTITGTANQITVTNGDGISGNPVISTPAIALIPVGAVWDYAGLTEPTGWLFCYGQAISRATYSALFTILSTTYGTGDGSTTFNIPDLRGRVVAGKDDMGGSSANRLTDFSGGVDGDVLGDVGGAESHTLLLSELAVHNHGGQTSAAGGHNHGLTSGTHNRFVTYNNGGFAAMADTAGTTNVLFTNGDISSTTATDTAPQHQHNISNAGSGDSHNNVQPTFILNKMIYTGV